MFRLAHPAVGVVDRPDADKIAGKSVAFSVVIAFAPAMLMSTNVDVAGVPLL